jgi:hypothetical protein
MIVLLSSGAGHQPVTEVCGGHRMSRGGHRAITRRRRVTAAEQQVTPSAAWNG